MDKSNANSAAFRTRTGNHSTKPLATGRYLEAPRVGERIVDALKRLFIAVTAGGEEIHSLEERISAAKKLANRPVHQIGTIDAQKALGAMLKRIQVVRHELSEKRDHLRSIQHNFDKSEYAAFREAARAMLSAEEFASVLNRAGEMVAEVTVAKEMIDRVLRAARKVDDLDTVCPGCGGISSHDRRSSGHWEDAAHRMWHRSCGRSELAARDH